MKTLPITLYTIPRGDGVPDVSSGAVGYDEDRNVYGLMSFGLLSYSSYRVEDLVTAERIEEMLATAEPFAFHVSPSSRLSVTARTFLETLHGFGLIGDEYADRISTLPETLAPERGEILPANPRQRRIAVLTKDLDEARLELEAALQYVDQAVGRMRSNAAESRYYTARNLPAVAADAAKLSERCRVLSAELHQLERAQALPDTVEQ